LVIIRINATRPTRFMATPPSFQAKLLENASIQNT
jgi:hypothetical protein